MPERWSGPRRIASKPLTRSGQTLHVAAKCGRLPTGFYYLFFIRADSPSPLAWGREWLGEINSSQDRHENGLVLMRVLLVPVALAISLVSAAFLMGRQADVQTTPAIDAPRHEIRMATGQSPHFWVDWPSEGCAASKRVVVTYRGETSFFCADDLGRSS
ncbi:hypothetical protein L0F51_03020 [Afifella sp. H1R]|uniref:hypothetical protein n=1 Tax=Afifella sp. H1R TaxID=2908841 RepID=UPI001F2A806F|nr:hypothetical protein [Afifella sp. H1R]MCF1502738.1 hypothetical protein [Afifella sp. H1R]